ncbi:uncharacterized protein E0L32_006745 [Thyridium curvatum]|uniref:BAG domain-containing protein n=1 Tax=Thyridium curvatum TaxID=1093900 RepID=A0A507APT8_9PEZI|nr:uncharacterized protein E0L32_006745 [Thyridium curvatum]TPX12865.1 hypothetical protein E0L32_006745 [Thyridium curvatum]
MSSRHLPYGPLATGAKARHQILGEMVGTRAQPEAIPPFPFEAQGKKSSIRLRGCPAKGRPHRPFKVASGSGSLASPGASFASLANVTSLLKIPPALQPYLDTTVDYLSSTLEGPVQYLHSATGLSHNAIYSTLAAVVLLGALPTVAARAKPAGKNKKLKRVKSFERKRMSRYGWSSGHGRPSLNTYNSGLGYEGTPHVTDQDYEYITSEELQNQGVNSQNAYQYDPRQSNYHFQQPSASNSGLEIEDDDIILFKHEGVTYPEHFPAYAIGDGKLKIGDVRERVQMLLKLSDAELDQVRLYYKGKELERDDKGVVPICNYNVKNNSELLVKIGRPDDAGSYKRLSRGGDSSEEIVVVGGEDDDEARRKSRKKKSSKKKKNRGEGNKSPTSPTSPGSSTTGLDVPGRGRDDRRGGSSSRYDSPGSGVSGASAAAAAPGGPLDKLNSISSHFTTKLLPLCVSYTAHPPKDAKKLVEEHRKLSETIMQQVLLKLDEVDTMGLDEARTRRKELVKQVQGVLSGLDEVKGDARD